MTNEQLWQMALQAQARGNHEEFMRLATAAIERKIMRDNQPPPPPRNPDDAHFMGYLRRTSDGSYRPSRR